MPSRIEFSKWQGLGNDYVIIAASSLDFNFGAGQAKMICDRHLGVGADGVLLWSGSGTGPFRLEIFNPDGSRAEMCGNGIRMLARHLYQTGQTQGAELAVRTDAGLIRPRVRDDGLVEVNMGRARLGGDGISGFDGEVGGEAVGQKLKVNGSEFEYTFVSMGNPHCVIETGEPGEVELEALGPAIEHHQLFPNRTNVEFMKVTGPQEVEMRVWERGVGETSACGTGACAVAVAAIRTRGVGSPVTVRLPGGELEIAVSPEMDVTMTGPAEEVYSGTMSEAFAKSIRES